MAMIPQRLDHIRRASQVAKWCAILAVVLFAILCVGLAFTDASPSTSGFVGWLATVAVMLAATSALSMLWSLVNVIIKLEATTHRMYDVMRDLHTSIEKHEEDLKTLSDNAQLSDAAKSITHREKERTALRLAINEEIIRGDWEAAYALVELLEERHGYKNEAMRLRQEVDRSRDRLQIDALHEAVEQVRTWLTSQNWDRARREMDRLLAEYPNDEQVAGLPAEFHKARGDQKRRLLKLWDETVQRNEVDRGIEILRELDQYLTPSEAAALEESARGVFKAKLSNMGVQFSLAIGDQNWAEALAVGGQIMKEFPNSRMAKEVHERFHILRQRAAEAGVSVPGPESDASLIETEPHHPPAEESQPAAGTD